MVISYCLLALGLIILDQISKYWASTALLNEGFIEVIPGVFEFRYTQNRGVAFSMLQDQRWVFIPVSILMTAILIVMLMHSPMRRSKLFGISTILVIAGAIGNLIDRIVLGYVVDFLYFRLIDFPIFNFADCCVVIGAVLLSVYLIFGVKDLENLPLRTLFFGINKKQEESTHG
ncbi:MAG: signal peptidase II [Lachnospiraceae bacterium]|nr:signal peptidase II [Lachnospiraceae bacterium]